MKALCIGVQKLIAEINEIKYIDKNWGQLEYEQPPVKFPAVLIDLNSVNYSQMGTHSQRAEADIEIIIADLKLTNSNFANPKKEDSYTVFDLIGEIHNKIQGCAIDDFSRLARTNLQKIAVGAGFEVYKLTYKTAWTIHKELNQKQVYAKIKVNQSE